MKQQSESQHQSHSGLTNESFETRKERMDKKRAIRKNKIGSVNEESNEIKDDKKLLTKEQKMQLQKAKNREAAQKSRDQHKKYVETLEEQNQHLREQLSRPKFCSKCSKEISQDLGDSTDSNIEGFSHERHFSTFVQNQNNQECEQFDSPFIRLNDYEESSQLKMFLFISMIMLGVFLISGSSDGSQIEGLTIKRDLMQIQPQEKDQIQINNHIELLKKKQKQIQEIDRFELRNQIQNSFNMDTEREQQIMTEVVPLSYQLSPLSQENCLKSIISSNFTTLSGIKYSWKEKINRKDTDLLKSTESNQMQVFSPSVKETNNHNMLFCSLPKLYRRNEEMGTNIFSKFIDIILSGSEMMEIIGKSPNLWMNKIVNFNGIYKINAQIKEISQIQDRNCIL